MGASTLPDRDDDGLIKSIVEVKPLANKDHHTFDGQGFTSNCPAGETTAIEYTIVTESDMSGVELLGAGLGDQVQMLVRDTPVGTYTEVMTGTAVPNAILNQFGTNWYIRPTVFIKEIPYGARVMPGMIICFEFTNNGEVAKDIYCNLDLHKVT